MKNTKMIKIEKDIKGMELVTKLTLLLLTDNSQLSQSQTGYQRTVTSFLSGYPVAEEKLIYNLKKGFNEVHKKFLKIIKEKIKWKIQNILII